MQSLTNEFALILYEIALSIGNSLDLSAMLKECLFTYIKRLNCTYAGVFAQAKTTDRLHYDHLFSIPRNAQHHVEAYVAHLIREGPPSDAQVCLGQSFAIVASMDERQYIHLMELPDLGLICLVRPEEPLDEYVVQSLAPLNRKLASACHACSQQRALQESESRVRTILESVQTGISIIDERTHTIEAVNPVAARMIGCSEDRIVGSKCHDFFCLSDKEDCPISDPRRHADSSEQWLRTARGDMTPILQTVTSIHLNDRPHLLESFIDISELHTARRQLQEMVQKLQRTNKDLTDFAHVAAHDLKTALRAIATVTDWLETEYGEKLGHQADEYLSILRSRTHRMFNLIEGLLQYSNIEVPRTPAKTVDLDLLVSEVVQQLQPPENIRIQIRKRLGSVSCHKSLLRQVFHHLIDNAVRYMDKPDGCVKISHVELNDVHQLSVTDNGPGIADKYHKKIFEIFQTLFLRDTSESTGIGLTAAKKIVELYGGRIWVESQAGEGSTFHFTLPRTDRATPWHTPGDRKHNPDPCAPTCGDRKDR